MSLAFPGLPLSQFSPMAQKRTFSVGTCASRAHTFCHPFNSFPARASRRGGGFLRCLFSVFTKLALFMVDDAFTFPDPCEAKGRAQPAAAGKAHFDQRLSHERAREQAVSSQPDVTRFLLLSPHLFYVGFRNGNSSTWKLLSF